MTDGWPFDEEGRSPRTRGSRRGGRRDDRDRGSIPAHAGEPSGASPRRGPPGVDPRARGGARVPSTFRQACAGRSPRTRGSPQRQVDPGQHQGSIPAHAGEPRAHRTRRWPQPVDPRARGGALELWRAGLTGGGRSPRTRGSPKPLVYGGGYGRSIPAHAGEPPWRWPWTAVSRVDPRARGGASGVTTPSALATGRSPRTRGSHRDPGRQQRRYGSIPAHAGEPQPRR